MKKNRMMRLASVLLVCVLLTTSVISGTFAKYVTSDSASDTARVAKWGVVATVSGDLFGATYSAAEDNSIITYSKNGGTVSSEDGAFVVAPGTKNDTGMTLSVKGAPEVATKVTVDDAEDADGKNFVNADIYLTNHKYGVMVAYTGTKTNENQVNYYKYDATAQTYTKMTAGETVGDWYELIVTNGQAFVAKNDAAKYMPINWKVGADAKQNVTEVKEAIVTALTYADGENRPNDDLSKLTKVTWSWDFGTAWADEADKGDPENTAAFDEQDTVLGNMMVGADAKVVVVDNDTTCTQVNYKTVDAGTLEEEATNANTVTVAYTGATYNKSNIVACLTVYFSARVTVEQVD